MNKLQKAERALVEFVERHMEEVFADPAKLAAWRRMPLYLQRQDVAKTVANLLRQRLGRVGISVDLETADFLTEEPESATGWYAAAVADAKLRGAEAGRAMAERKIAVIYGLVGGRADYIDEAFDMDDDIERVH
jgi:hypothetical protein